MAYNGSGTFVINTAGQPVVPNTVISATAFNALTADLANGLSTCITKDGQTTPTANIPMGNNKITGLAPGTSGTDAANLSQVQGSTAKLLQSVTGTDTITAAMVPALTSYSAGQMFYFVAAGDNTGAVTINIDSLGAKSVTRDGSTALVAGDITNGKVVVIVYDGTRFQLLNSNAFTNLYISGNLGVGTASPVAKLSVQDASVPKIALQVGGAERAFLSYTESNFTTRLDSDGPLVFAANNAEVGRFDVLGNLGIGTSSPVYPLVVSAGGAQGLEFSPTALASAPLIQSYNRSGAAYTQLSFDASLYVFRISGTERMRLDSSGNLGLGVTPTTIVGSTGSNGNGFQTTSLTISSYAGTDQTYFATNAYTTSYVGGWTYRVTASATRYDQASGSHIWYNAPSGTAGNAITFTQAMTLDASGNLGIGTASPTYRVDTLLGAGSGNIVRFGQTGVSNGYTITTSGTALTHEWATAGSVSMRIDANANIVAGASVALATTATDGFLYVPTCAGTPTGTPTAITGMAPIVVNTTNNKLYFYSGGVWRDAGP